MCEPDVVPLQEIHVYSDSSDAYKAKHEVPGETSEHYIHVVSLRQLINFFFVYGTTAPFRYNMLLDIRGKHEVTLHNAGL